MTNQRQWSMAAGIVTTLLFGVTLALKIRPQLESVGVSSRAPDFRAVNLATGRPASLADYRGKVVLLNIWATWCQPCRVEMPSLERLYREFRDTDFRVVAVSVDTEDSSVVTAFARDLGLSFDILYDRAGAIQRGYQSIGVPESFVLDREGLIVKRVIGAAQWDAPVNEILVRRLLDAR